VSELASERLYLPADEGASDSHPANQEPLMSEMMKCFVMHGIGKVGVTVSLLMPLPNVQPIPRCN